MEKHWTPTHFMVEINSKTPQTSKHLMHSTASTCRPTEEFLNKNWNRKMTGLLGERCVKRALIINVIHHNVEKEKYKYIQHT